MSIPSPGCARGVCSRAGSVGYGPFGAGDRPAPSPRVFSMLRRRRKWERPTTARTSRGHQRFRHAECVSEMPKLEGRGAAGGFYGADVEEELSIRGAKMA